MNRLLLSLDRWLQGFLPVTPESLGLCRIFFAGFFLLFNIPVFSRIGANPPAFFTPPPLSFAALFNAFPPSSVLFALDLSTCVLLVMLLVGFKTRPVSIMLSLAWIAGSSFLYSFGKIDHTILAIITPFVMAFSGWGARYSIDEKRAPAPTRVQAWPLTFLALFVAFGFFSAGFPKLRAWVDFDLGTHGARSWLVGGWYELDRRSFLAPFFMELNNPVVWEAMDYVAVAFEVGFIFSIFGRGLFRSFVFIAVMFHLMNVLMLNIGFEMLVPVYLIFAPWERLGISRESALARTAERLTSFPAMAAALALFLPLYALVDRIPIDQTVIGFSHLGVLFGFLSIDFESVSGIVVHGAAAISALLFAGMPKGVKVPDFPPPGVPSGKPIVFFDGVCNLCNGFVDLLIRWRRSNDLFFASLQSEAGGLVRNAHKPMVDARDFESMLFVGPTGLVYERADAALEALNSLRGPVRMLKVFWLVPRPIRNGMYRIVARSRYILFGKRETCRIPTPEERALFL